VLDKELLEVKNNKENNENDLVFHASDFTDIDKMILFAKGCVKL
jgi:hypothetical protein